jgi:hypothetical protein
MPRFYFHLLDESSANLVRDSAGTCLPNANEAQREAIGLAQDIIRHQLHGSTWQVVVTDAIANVVFTVPFAKVRPQRFRAVFDRVRSLALYEPRFRPHIFTWLLTAVVIALIMESAMLSGTSGHTADPIETKRGCRTC